MTLSHTSNQSVVALREILAMQHNASLKAGEAVEDSKRRKKTMAKAQRYEGSDDAGRTWWGDREGDTILWRSNDDLSGTEKVVDLPDGGMSGVSATGDVKPCDYDGSHWDGRGACPDGDYTKK